MPTHPGKTESVGLGPSRALATVAEGKTSLGIDLRVMAGKGKDNNVRLWIFSHCSPLIPLSYSGKVGNPGNIEVSCVEYFVQKIF